ncbi:MAG: hypothetical protein QOJ06_1221 [Pseudonocardiales bacterium]|jgi:hypothetical protein|nr:hypothetical protein [Pseudonocardiales bacterium]
MARKVKATLVDDITGDAAVETVNFGLDGVEFEIDLSANNAGILRDIFADYANAGRKVGKRAAVSTGRSRRPQLPAGIVSKPLRSAHGPAKSAARCPTVVGSSVR